MKFHWRLLEIVFVSFPSLVYILKLPSDIFWYVWQAHTCATHKWECQKCRTEKTQNTRHFQHIYNDDRWHFLTRSIAHIHTHFDHCVLVVVFYFITVMLHYSFWANRESEMNHILIFYVMSACVFFRDMIKLILTSDNQWHKKNWPKW